MFDTLDEVLQQLRAGEDGRTEFKEVRLRDQGIIAPNTEDLAGEMVAFANADGGCIFLGVDDAGVVRRLPEDRVGDIERWVVNVASNACDPPVRPIVRRERLPRPEGPEGLVMLVEVRRGLYVHRTSGGRYFVRVGSTKRDLTSQELPRLLQQRGRAFVFDEQAVLTATPDDLDRNRLEAFFGSPPAIPWPDLLRNTRVTAEEERAEHPTVAGLLAFGKDPQRHLPSAFIEAAVYRGARLSSDDLVHPQRTAGTVDGQIDEATEFGSKIRLFLFADRLEIYSPGGPPNTLTIETMPYRVFTRNQLLVSFLSRMRGRRSGRAFLESRGEGVRRILEESERHAGRRPVYELFGEELRLTIWAKPSPHEGDPAP